MDTRYFRCLMLFLLCSLIAACSQSKIQEKQLQWRVECEQMMLKGADGLINHHDCYNRCLQHYNQYCFNRCEGALLEGDAKREEVDKHCKGYLKSYLSKKCHHVCELSVEELKEYRLSYVQKLHEKMHSQSACGAWDKSDNFMSSVRQKPLDPMDDSFNQFRQPSLDKRLMAKKLRQDQMSDLPWLADKHNSPLSSNRDLPWLSVSNPSQSNSSQDGDDDEDDLNPDSSQDEAFTDGFVPAGKISIRGNTSQIDALFQQLQSSQGTSNASSPTSSNASMTIGDMTHTVENEILQSRDTARAIKDISSLFKGGK
jgi:hypothetical protein